MKHVKEFFRGFCLVLTIITIATPAVFAETASSPNYMVNETFFGSGGELESCSGDYCSKQSAGELTVGNTSSGSYQAWAGFNTTDEPFLEFVVTGNNIDLGYLDTATATTTTGSFYVRAWQADGYVVRTASEPPTNYNNQQITPLSSASASSPGTEQFGINLVDNSTPDVGTDPQQYFAFSYGVASSGYNTPDLFKYVNGDTVAASTESSGITAYTVSYLYNISNATPSGEYIFNHVLVATGTY